MNAREVVRKNLEWFRSSGIMRPEDGFWGVAERIVLTDDNVALTEILSSFPSYSRPEPGCLVVEHRRADCNFEVALLFDWAAEALGERAYRMVADHLLDYLVDRSCLRVIKPESPVKDLWGWANPFARERIWTDDNAWVIMGLLIFARRGRPHLKDAGIAAARCLREHAVRYLDQVERTDGMARLPGVPLLSGLFMNPHWMGLVTMALAHAAAVDPATDYASVIRTYYRRVGRGPLPSEYKPTRIPSGTTVWNLSEQAYLSLLASTVARQCDFPEVREAARAASDRLVATQSPVGHWSSEHHETPEAPQLADLIYTQNWATLGLWHAARLFGCDAYRSAYERSLEFLARIQDAGPSPRTRGCWRGLYDTATRTWGGGDRYEGGARSLYSGWTNAPVAWTFLLEEGTRDFFPRG